MSLNLVGGLPKFLKLVVEQTSFLNLVGDHQIYFVLVGDQPFVLKLVGGQQISFIFGWVAKVSFKCFVTNDNQSKYLRKMLTCGYISCPILKCSLNFAHVLFGAEYNCTVHASKNTWLLHVHIFILESGIYQINHFHGIPPCKDSFLPTILAFIGQRSWSLRKPITICLHFLVILILRA